MRVTPLLSSCLLIILALLKRDVAYSFSVQRSLTSATQRYDTSINALKKGDTVLVVGGTGGVGQLVASKLASSGYKVRATCRNAETGREILANDKIDVVSLDLVNSSDNELQAALNGASAAVITVGTTAFPTKRWANGNNPKAIDDVAVTRLAKAAVRIKSMQKIVLLTSVGVDRTSDFPFVILNLFGVLDAKKSGEQAVKQAVSGKKDCSFVILRPGRLVGGPFTNLDVAKLLQVQGGAENGVDIQLGDSLLGDCKRDACAEAVVQCLRNTDCANMELSIVSNEKSALTDAEWTSLFKSL